MQLISNMQSYFGQDLFYIEEDEFLNLLKKYVEEHKNE